jgi:serine protease Do
VVKSNFHISQAVLTKFEGIMTMSRSSKGKLHSYWIICGLTTMLLIVASLHFSKDPAAHKISAPAALNSGSFSRLVKIASPSVVNISAVKVIKTPGQYPSPFGSEDPLKEFFEKFFGERMPGEFRQNSMGTGFIIDKDNN